MWKLKGATIPYMMLVALLVATSAALFSTYLYMLDNIKDMFAGDLDIALKALLSVEPGQTAETYVAVPKDTKIVFCPGEPSLCSPTPPQCQEAPGCIRIISPVRTTDIPTQAIIKTPQHQIPTGTYVIKAHAEIPDKNLITACRIIYQAIQEATQKPEDKTCNEIKQIINLIPQEVLPQIDVSKICDATLEFYRIACVKKVIYIDITPS